VTDHKYKAIWKSKECRTQQKQHIIGIIIQNEENQLFHTTTHLLNGTRLTKPRNSASSPPRKPLLPSLKGLK